MFKGIAIFIITLFMSFNTIAMGTVVPQVDIKSCIGKSIAELDKNIQVLSKQGKVKLICEDLEYVTDIFVKDSSIPVDSIRVGDSLESVYEVFPGAWINNHKRGIAVLLERDTHYGIATKYIIFLTQDNKTISEIQLGYTAGFTGENLATSNREANQLLQGKWQSKYGKILEFKDGQLKDSQLDKLYNEQRYIVISPNEMILYRGLENKNEKMSLRFWVTENTLYIFSVNSLGLPIRDTVEEFYKVK